MSDFRLDWNEAELTGEVHQAAFNACLNGARDVAIDAKTNVPVDEGDLLFSIEVASFQKPDAVGAYVKAGADGKEHIAAFVELGTPGTVYKKAKTEAGRKKIGKDRTPIKAKPYMRPALKKNKAKITAKFEGALK